MTLNEKRFQWLKDHAGYWSCDRSNTMWTKKNGKTYYPKVSFSAHDCAFYGMTFVRAVNEAMKRFPNKPKFTS
jgi:hypothetical protein